jgi:hypothetical protein
MKLSTATLPIGALLTLASLAAFQAPPTAFLKNSEVYVRQAGTDEARQVTDDGRPKRLLVQSKSGDRIAFVRDSPGELANIVVMRSNGSGAREIHFRPAGVKILGGMRFVEDLSWISEQRLVASGSFNPSTCEYAMIDIDSGTQVLGFLTDGFSLVASPDGTHVAYIGQIPHFMLEEKRRPEFCLDDECTFDQPFRGYQRVGAHLEYPSKPVWSSDGSAVAILAKDYDSNVESVVVRPLGAKSVEFIAPTGIKGDLQFSWDGKALVAQAGDQAWRLDPGKADFVRTK